MDYDLAVVRGEIAPDPIYKFDLDTEYCTSVIPEKDFHAFITKDFEDVYRKEPKDSFRNEWIFIPRPLVFNPDKREILPVGLPVNVRIDEPCFE